MTARPFHPSMNKPRRKIHGAIHTTGGIVAFVAIAWAGQHGLGHRLGDAAQAVLEASWLLVVWAFWVALAACGVSIVAAAIAGLLGGVAWLCRRILIDPQEEDQ